MARAPRINVNNRIRASEVRLVDANGKQHGVVPLAKALQVAREAQLDLVEVASGVKPPVCKIMDYSRFKYEQEKRQREAKKKQHTVHVKEIKMSSKIQEHDYQTKLSHLHKFLERKDKAKVTMFFRGREMAHVDIGRKILDRLTKDLADVAEPESMPKREGKLLILKFQPK
ncbi:MAG: translation initiation factor IF-3 [Candidatus Omnitrophica bacterium]|nr:translation initiation factor IF-3 [Candidatus Omnitrophota bacterium]